MPIQLFSFRPERKYRIFAITGALVLGLLSIFLTIAITGSLLDLQEISLWPGDFFVGSYGILAFIVPAYLFCAALLLADPAYRPDRIFTLSCTLFPFLTMSIGFAFIRDFETQAEQFPFLAMTGKTGFGFFTVILTVLEGILIIALTSLFFPKPGHPKFGRSGRPQRTNRQPGQEPAEPQNRAKLALLPAPVSNLKTIYTRTAASVEGWDKTAESPPAEDVPEDIKIPDLKPLASAAALEAIEAGEKWGYPLKQKEAAGSSADTGEDEGEDNSEDTGTDEYDRIDEDDRAEIAGEDEDDQAEIAGEGEDDQTENDDGNEDDQAENDGEGENTGLEDTPEIVPLEAAEYLARREEPDRTRNRVMTGPVAAVPRKKRWGPYEVPVEGILNQYPDGQYWIIDQGTREAAVTLKETLKEFNIQAEVTGIRKG
ncbi:MAG: hypothetical protein LBP43_06035, partial [Treponema sp.]|nr:hypothetical protein [Treponema sp.]